MVVPMTLARNGSSPNVSLKRGQSGFSSGNFRRAPHQVRVARCGHGNILRKNRRADDVSCAVDGINPVNQRNLAARLRDHRLHIGENVVPLVERERVIHARVEERADMVRQDGLAQLRVVQLNGRRAFDRDVFQRDLRHLPNFFFERERAQEFFNLRVRLREAARGDGECSEHQKRSFHAANSARKTAPRQTEKLPRLFLIRRPPRVPSAIL
jgi:hypothetical protein